MTAIEAVSAEQPPLPIQDTSALPDPAEDRRGETGDRPGSSRPPVGGWPPNRQAARKADALVAICKQAGALAGSPEGLVSDPESCQLVVHVDVGVLTGEEPQGRCHLKDGTPLSAAVARRLGCDAQVVTITEREGLPIDVGRSRRLFSKPQRRALQARDGTCRFPGCGVPARRTHLHHLLAWELGGPTDLANALSLCSAHHSRVHDGHYQILRSPDGELRFVTRDGGPIVPPPARIDPSSGGGTAHLRRLAHEHGHQIGDMTPMALDGGQPPDYGLAIEMLIHDDNLRQARAGPSPP